MRIRYFADFVKIERLAILPHYRKSRYGARGVAWALGEFALDFCRRKGFTRFYGHALEDLVPFWNKLSGGFLLPMPGEAPFECSGKMVVPMFGETEAKSDAITHDSGHYVIVRPEGNWDSPGYWELSEVPVKCA
ncbi:GNAT family N-acetyltransferase, partial [Paramagnetospirillum caucaseum]